MGGLFGAASGGSCVYDVFFGTDYHSHLGTKRGGMAVAYPDGSGNIAFERSIHNISNSPFRTKFESDIEQMHGNIGIGCISDNDPQPLIVRSHLGNYAVATVGKINNLAELTEEILQGGKSQFLEMSGGEINQTELFAALVNRADSIPEGIREAQKKIDGSLTALIMTGDGIYAARDYYGRTPLVIGSRDKNGSNEGAYCVSFESFAFHNLGYHAQKELAAGEIVYITPDGYKTVMQPNDKMKICAFLWVYYGYPTSVYEGVNVEQMRYDTGKMLARRDKMNGNFPTHADSVAGVPDSGTPHAIGYANESGIPFQRPFIKYTPTWPRSFMPPTQSMRDFIAHMKLIPVLQLIKGRSLVLIDDSIVRGTQLRETAEFLYSTGAKEVHIRPACPPLVYACKYLNFSRSTSVMDLITRRVIAELEGSSDVSPQTLAEYANPDSPKYAAMVEGIRKIQGFTSLSFNRLDDLIAAVGIDPDKVCTYCWNGRG